MNYQNLHLADKSLFTQYRTLFKTNITNAHAVLEDSQLEGKSFLAGDYNDLADDIHTLENNYYSNVPETLNSLLSAFNLDVTRIVYRGTYSSSATYYLYNVVSYTTGGATNLYLCKPANHSTAISNIVPTNTSTWLNLGLQGDQGAPTIGNLKYEGDWVSSKTYSVGDVIFYNSGDINDNTIYVLKTASPGTTPPPSNSKWVVLVSVDRRKINFSTTNLQNGDIYWQELT